MGEDSQYERSAAKVERSARRYFEASRNGASEEELRDLEGEFFMAFTPMGRTISRRIFLTLPRFFEDIEDLRQEGNIRLLTTLRKKSGSFNQYPRATYFSTNYKYGILDRTRILRRLGHPLALDLGIELERACVQEDSKLRREELRRVIDGSLGGLKNEGEEIIILYYFGGLNLREIGEVLGIKGSRASQIHRKALKNLGQKPGMKQLVTMA